MKKHLLSFLVLLLLTTGFANAQISILIVDDSDDGFGHVSDFENIVTDLGYTFSSYDAQGIGMVPAAGTLNAYDLVIWHTGSDGDSLAFWNFNDGDNTDLKSYLDQGGMLWAIGTDLLYDRYSSAPAMYAAGDFPRDYMGVFSYDSQSYADDGGLGMPTAEPDAGSVISSLPVLDWIFSTLWYVDAVTPVPGVATPVYNMGDSTYIFAGRNCALWAENTNSKVLSMFFNVSQIGDSVTFSDMTEKVLNHFQSQMVSVDLADVQQMQVFPNPAQGQFAVNFPADIAGAVSMEVYSAAGVKVFSREFTANGQQVNVTLPEVAPGMYFLRVRAGEQEFRGRVVMQ